VGDIAQNTTGDIAKSTVGDIAQNTKGDIAQNTKGDIAQNMVAKPAQCHGLQSDGEERRVSTRSMKEDWCVGWKRKRERVKTRFKV